jgi:hypothetical protein
MQKRMGGRGKVDEASTVEKRLDTKKQMRQENLSRTPLHVDGVN